LKPSRNNYIPLQCDDSGSSGDIHSSKQNQYLPILRSPIALRLTEGKTSVSRSGTSFSFFIFYFLFFPQEMIVAFSSGQNKK